MRGNIDQEKIKKFRTSLLKWYRKGGRHFAWRRTRDPYKILLAEILLQRTKADRVEPVYRALVRRHPTVSNLARARLAELKKLLNPLGLVHRAPRIKKMAIFIVKEFRGVIPDSSGDLLRLPGVGRYAANAFLCFAHNKPVAVVDANVVRVLRRVFGLNTFKLRPHLDDLFWKMGKKLVPKQTPREFNYALLDHGGTVCVKKPKCHICPLTDICFYYERVIKRGLTF